MGTLTLLPSDMKVCLKAVKLTLPKPVTGSQPTAALKPSAQQTEEATQLLIPEVMSLRRNEVGDRVYREGLIQPRLDFPAANLAAFT